MIDRTKTLLYWKKINVSHYYGLIARYERISLDNNIVVWIERRYFERWEERWDHYYSVGKFSSLDEAVADADKTLLSLGYVLLTKEQSDKYRVLL